MSKEPPLFLNLNGIPSAEPGESALYRDPQGGWRLIKGDLLFDIDDECVKMDDAIAGRIFGSLQAYHALLPYIPEALHTAGLNSEGPLSKDQFQKFVQEHVSKPLFNQLMYFLDLRKQISGVQECSKEIIYLFGEFYRALNLDEMFYPPQQHIDGVNWVSSPVTTNITATLAMIYVRMHSLADYLTKVAYEAEHLKSDFSSAQKLASSSILFGDRKRIKLNGRAKTLFEPSELMNEIESVRNQVVHDGLLDSMPKAYRVTANGVAIEKYVLMPDMTNGRFDKYINRTLFYGGEHKINLTLPERLEDFQGRVLETVKIIAR